MWLLRGEFIRPPRDVGDLSLLNKSKLVHEQPITRQVNSAFVDATDHSGEGSFLLKHIHMNLLNYQDSKCCIERAFSYFVFNG